jgi:hypothetical protein
MEALQAEADLPVTRGDRLMNQPLAAAPQRKREEAALHFA